MNDLILILCLCLTISSQTQSQGTSMTASPVIKLNSSHSSITNADAWGADLCIFRGDPSQLATSQGISFTMTDTDTPANMVSATATSSNTNVVPVLVEFLKITYTVSPTNPNQATINIMINPFSTGVTDIVISVKDKDKNTANYYIDLTVKDCRNNLTINQSRVDVVTPPNNVYQVNRRISTSGTPANSTNGPIVRANDDIVFNAGRCIELNPGFEVVRRGLFLAEIKACDN